MSTLGLDVATEQLLASLQSDYDATTPDAHVIAQQVVYQKQAKGQPTPKATDLAAMLTGIASDHTTGSAGAPTLVLTILDPSWTLLDSQFFDTDAQGRLLDLDLQYPEGSRFWWRLHQVSPQQDKSIQLTFVPRIVGELMGLFGPIKVNRASRTRAQFLKMLCAKVKDKQGPIEFYSRELNVVEPVANSGPKVSTSSSAKVKTKGAAAKLVGVGANRQGLTVKGAKMTTKQSETANIILQVGDQLAAPKNALVAAIYAATGESDLGADTSGGGVFQTTGDPSAYNGGSDTAGQARGFFTGGTSFGSPGAIKRANAGQPPWMIANATEVNAVWLASHGDSYTSSAAEQAQRTIECAAIVDGGGGAKGSAGGETGTISVAQPYYFQINAGEDYWTGMNRLAQEVAWELIVDGNRIYYDSDTTLIRQKVAAVIDRDDPTTLAWNYDWVNRQLATNFQVQVVSQPFEFAAGEVMQLAGFGPASTGSTVKLPGRWLIDEIQRSPGDLYSTFSLVQPTPPLAEPAPQMTTQTVGGGAAGAAGGVVKIPGTIQQQQAGTAEAAYAAAQYLASLKLIYSKGNRTMVRSVGNQAGKACYDCSASVSWVLLAAGFELPGNVTWGGWAPVSGDYIGGTSGLVSGPGQTMTIYANGDHVFIRIHPQGLSDMQGNTVSPLVHMRGFDFFPWTTPGCGGWGGPSPGVGAPSFWQVHYPGT